MSLGDDDQQINYRRQDKVYHYWFILIFTFIFVLFQNIQCVGERNISDKIQTQ